MYLLMRLHQAQRVPMPDFHLLGLPKRLTMVYAYSLKRASNVYCCAVALTSDEGANMLCSPVHIRSSTFGLADNQAHQSNDCHQMN